MLFLQIQVMVDRNNMETKPLLSHVKERAASTAKLAQMDSVVVAAEDQTYKQQSLAAGRTRSPLMVVAEPAHEGEGKSDDRNGQRACRIS